MKRIGLILLVVFAILGFDGFGCKGLIVEDAGTKLAETPYDKTTSPSVIETKKEIIPERIEIVSKAPQGNYPKLRRRPTSKSTIIKLQDKARRTGQVIFVNNEKLPVEIEVSHGKWGWRWADPGTIFLAKFSQDAVTGVKQYLPTQDASCWNLVRGVEIRVHPMVEKITERYREIVTERYRAINTKIDYSPGLWAIIAGLVIGGLWPRRKQNVGTGQ